MRIVGMAFGFLMGVQLARGLGPAGYGVYGTAMAVISILMIPTELGLPQLVMREVAAALASDGAGATDAIVRWARKVVIFSSLLIAGVAMCALAMKIINIDAAVRLPLLIGLIWIPVVAFGNIHGAALRGMRLIMTGQIGEILIRPVLVSLFLFLIAWQAKFLLTPACAMGINVLGALLGASWSFFMLKRADPGMATSSAAAPPGLRFSHTLPIAMTEGMRVVAGQLSVLVLAALASKEDVGLYRVANGIYIAAAMPSALINVACAPTISRLFTQGNLRQLARLNISASIFLASASALAIVLCFLFGKVAITILFGSVYADAWRALLVLLVGDFIASLFGYPTVVLNMMRRQQVVMWWSGAALLINFLVSWLLVSKVGYTGAAFGALAGTTIWRAGCGAYAKRRLGMDTGLVTKLIPVRG